MNQGDLGEIKAASHFMHRGYQVFYCLGKGSFDLVVTEDGTKLERVEVKCTKTRTKTDTGWVVQIKSLRPNRSKTTIKRFDSTRSDLLVVFIEPIDRIVVFKSSDIKTTCALTILDTDL